MLPIRLLAFPVCLHLLAAPTPARQAPVSVHKLNGTLDHRPTREVSAFRLGPDGTRAFYLADVDRDGLPALFSAPVDGSSAAQRVNLTPAFVFAVLDDFQVSPDGARVVFRAGTPTTGLYHLYSARTADGVFVRLEPSTQRLASVETGFRISANGTRVVYRSDQATDGVVELWSVPIDGSAAPIRLNSQLASNRDVLDFDPTPDGTRVVYRSDERFDDRIELFSVPINAFLPPTRLSQNLTAPGDVTAFRVGPGGRVVYVADKDVDDLFEVFSVPADRSTDPVRLSHDHAVRFVEPEIDLTGAGARVVYRFPLTEEANPAYQLFGAPLDGSLPAVQLTDLAAPGVASGFRTGPSRSALFRATDPTFGATHLFAVPADGSAPATRLDGLPEHPGAQVLEDFRFAAGGAEALYRASEPPDPAQRLFAAPLDGSGARELSGPLVPGGDVRSFREAGGHVAYLADASRDGIAELFLVPRIGPGGPVRLNLDLAPGRKIEDDFQPTADGTVLYRSDELVALSPDLVSARTDRLPVPLNPPFPASTFIRGSVSQYQIAGERVVYSARERVADVFELYSVPLRSPGGSIVLHEGRPGRGVGLSFQLTTDARRVFYGAETDDGLAFYSVPVDGSQAPVRLSAPLETGSRFFGERLSSDGRWAAYLRGNFVRRMVYAAPVDGSEPERLVTPLPAFASVVAFRFVPGSHTIVYNADQDFDERIELYSAPVDGSGPSVRIGTMQNGGGKVVSFKPASDGRRVAYSADQVTNDQYELFVTPVDGSAPSRRLSPPMATGDLRNYFLTPDATRVAFMVGTNLGGKLFSVPLGGSSVRTVELSPSLNPQRVYKLSPDSSHAVYTDHASRIFSVPLDGRTLPVPLQDDTPKQARAFGTAITADSSRVVFLGVPPAPGNKAQVFSTPLGGGPTTQLNPPFVGSRTASRFFLSPVGNTVAYLATQEGKHDQALYLVPADGSAVPVRMTPPSVDGGGVFAFQFGAHPTEGVYLADQEFDDAFELYFTEQVTKAPRAAGPLTLRLQER